MYIPGECSPEGEGSLCLKAHVITVCSCERFLARGQRDQIRYDQIRLSEHLEQWRAGTKAGKDSGLELIKSVL